MTAHILVPQTLRRTAGRLLVLPFALVAGLLAAGAFFVAYMLWPTWPSTQTTATVPSLPITIADALFEVPRAAIRVAVQRTPGPHERIDLAFLWPSLAPAGADAGTDDESIAAGEDDAGAAEPVAGDGPQSTAGRLFVVIAPLGAVLPPKERLRTIYPRYVEAQAKAGANGLAILPFRAGTPYAGEDLIYLAADPDRFFALCTRQSSLLPGTCLLERAVGAAEVRLRFARRWLDDWRSVDAGVDRLMTGLHPSANPGCPTPEADCRKR